MNSVNRLLKLNRFVKSPTLKFLGLYTLYSSGRRYLSIQFDPVMACNLRCKMCYFTDEDVLKRMKGMYKPEDLPYLARALFHRAVKLQVGCGTEPTLYKNLDRVFELGAKYKVPHISMTTNANLLPDRDVESWIKSGLNEFIISLHGVHKDSYEEFMGKASYEKFHEALGIINELKQKYPRVSLRINYTFNKDNFVELNDFFKVYGKYQPDTLQIRPMKNMGNTAYTNTDISSLADSYDSVLANIKELSIKHNITLLAATKYQSIVNSKHTESLIYKDVYCYIRPGYVWRDDFNWREESFEDYARKNKFGTQFLKKAFSSKEYLEKLKNKQALNYEVIN